MRKGMVGMAVGLVALVLAAQAWAQQNEIPFDISTVSFNIKGQGARALAMGGAFIGIADDATAISWNPGGLGQLDRPEVSGVFKFSAKSGSWSPSSVTFGGTSVSFAEYKRSDSHFAVDFGSVAMPVKLGKNNLVFAFAYQQQFDFYKKIEQDPFTYTITNINPPYNVDTLRGPDIDKTTGGVFTISPGIGFQVIPQLSLGAAFNIWTGSPTRKWTRNFTSIRSSYGSTRTYEETDKLNIGGWNLTFGALVNVKPAKFGVVLRTPVSFKNHMNTTWRRNLTSTYWNTSSYPQTNTYRDPVSGDYKMKLPLMVGFGASVKPIPNLTIAADFDMRPMSSVTLEDSAGTDTRTYGDTLDWPNSNQIRIGLEYLAMLGGGLLPLRAGFYTDPTTYRHIDFNSTTKGGQVTGFGFTFGTGFAIKHFQFDAAYGLNMVSQKTTWNILSSPSPATSKWNEKTHSILGSMIFKF